MAIIEDHDEIREGIGFSSTVRKAGLEMIVAV
jgi:hypothetical protein